MTQPPNWGGINQDDSTLIEVSDDANTQLGSAEAEDVSTSEVEVLGEDNNITIDVNNVFKGEENTIKVTVPEGTGTVNITVGNDTYTPELISGVATQSISKYADGINTVTVKYNDLTKQTTFKALDGVVTNETYDDYFDATGTLYDYIPEGATLDFRGSFYASEERRFDIYINKPVNIVSTTKDAFICLNTETATQNPSNNGYEKFTIAKSASGTNVSDITFKQTQVLIYEASNVTVSNINMSANDRIYQKVPGYNYFDNIGLFELYNCENVILKNSYIYGNNTYSSLVAALGCTYCLIDNNIIVCDYVGYNCNVRNGIYFTRGSSVSQSSFSNITNNKFYGGAGMNQIYTQSFKNFLIENNIDFEYETWITNGIRTAGNDIIRNNTMGMYPGVNSTLYNNTISTLQGTNLTVFGNYIMDSNSLTKVIFFNNTAGGSQRINIGEQSIVYDNQFYGSFSIAGDNSRMYNNTFSVTQMFIQGTYNIISDNYIDLNGDYVIIQDASSRRKANYNNVSNNKIYTSKYLGNDALHDISTYQTSIIENNTPNQITLTVEATDATYGETVTITVNVAGEGNVTIKVNDDVYSAPLSAGVAVLNVTKYKAGENTVSALFDDGESGGVNSTTFNIDKVTDYTINVSSDEPIAGNNVTVTVTLPEDATGKVTATVNEIPYETNVTDGSAVFEIPDLLEGTYNMTVVYEGCEKYVGNTTTTTIKVNKNKETTIIVFNVTAEKLVSEYEAILIDYLGNGIMGVTLTIDVNGQTIEAITDEYGIATFDLALTRGYYPVVVSFAGIEDEYNASEASAQINVIDATVIDITGIDGFNVMGVLKDVFGNIIANANISYSINGGEKVNTTTDDEGRFIVPAEDNCLVEVFFGGDEISTSSYTYITLENIKPIRQATDIDVELEFTRYANDFNAGERGGMFYFILKDGDGKILTNKTAKIGINGVIYSVVTDSEGKAGLQINLAKSTAYTYAIAYLGDDEYNASFAVSKLNLVKKPITITPKKTSYTFTASAKNKYVEATLSTIKNEFDGKMYLSTGKKVTLTINGKTYTATAGKNGAIKFNIGSTTKKGTYKVTIKYAGDATYEAGTSKTITIKLS